MCASRGTVETFERFGRRTYFCVECEHSWSSRDSQTPDAIRNRRRDHYDPSSNSQNS